MTTTAVTATAATVSGGYVARVSGVLVRFWRMFVLFSVLGAGLGAFLVARTTPVYEARVNFLVSTRNSPTDLTGSSLADDRARIYAALADAGELARRVKRSVRVAGSADAIARTVSGQTDLDSAVVHLAVRTSSSQRSLLIAQGVAASFPAFVSSLDDRGARTPTIILTETSAPSVASTPVSPHKGQSIVLGLVGGLLMASLLAWIRHRVDGSVRTRDELGAALAAPVLGEIPFDAGIAAGEAPTGPTHEAFRALRTNTGFLAAAERAEVLIVSAADRFAGTTTVVATLATAAAADGQRVVVVDANQPHSGLARFFGRPDAADPGLIDVLYGRSSLAAAVHETAEGPDVLPVGHGLRYALTDGRTPVGLAEVITELRGRFDLVLVDTPPAGQYADAAAVALAGADGVVLVARYARTRTSALREARHALEVPGIPLLGAVLTCREVRRSERYEYYGV